MTHKEQLKDPRWQRKRLEIMGRDKFACRSCYDHESTLKVHHIEYNGKYLWDAFDDDMITLCQDCHTEWHRLFDKNPNPVRTYLVARLKNQKQIEEMQLDIKIDNFLNNE
jgi:5-methylcytosine-specific restriction endonuclease McrA